MEKTKDFLDGEYFGYKKISDFIISLIYDSDLKFGERTIANEILTFVYEQKEIIVKEYVKCQ